MLIFTFLWGNTFADNRAIEYLIKLKNSLRKNISNKFDLYCFTDSRNIKQVKNIADYAIEIETPTIFNKYNLRKLCIYNHNYQFPKNEKVLVLDLDLLILNNINEIINYYTNYNSLFIRSTFYNPEIPDGDIFFTNTNILNNKDNWNFILSKKDEILNKTNGREVLFYQYYYNYIYGEIQLIQDAFPNTIYSYKNHIRKLYNDKLPHNNIKFISFHGKPKIHELLNLDFVSNNWNFS
ncbi:MAG: hypothetical protein K9H48_21310 [Melioribacteraceae bacterium]|nr:hypothetical protein [Melioribacteraceae bacterium]